MPQVTVERVIIPTDSTVGYGFGHEEDGSIVVFAGDQRMMRDLGAALSESADPIVVDPPEWAILLRVHNPESNGR